MKKESKNTGISRACPNCRKMVVRAANFSALGSWFMKCPHCKNLLLAEIKPSLIITALTVAVIILGTIYFIAPWISQYKDTFIHYVTEREE